MHMFNKDLQSKWQCLQGSLKQKGRPVELVEKDLIQS